TMIAGPVPGENGSGRSGVRDVMRALYPDTGSTQDPTDQRGIRGTDSRIVGISRGPHPPFCRFLTTVRKNPYNHPNDRVTSTFGCFCRSDGVSHITVACSATFRPGFHMVFHIPASR